jgi:putative spermidine/putrescine transport system permease protein
MSRNGPLALIYHTLFVIFVLAPILVVCVVAFTPEGYLSLPSNGPSLRWFKTILRYPEFIDAFFQSLWLGAISSAFAVAFSVPAALAIARYEFRGREAFTALFLSPLMIPHVVLGVAFLRFFSQIGLGGTFAGLVLSHIVIVLPFALRLILAAATGMNREIEHAAVSLGASQWTVFRRVTLPLIVPGLTSGWVLAFINSFDEVTMTVFIASPSTVTLPVRMFLYIQDNIDPLVTSVSACVIAVTVVAMIILERAYGRRRRRACRLGDRLRARAGWPARRRVRRRGRRLSRLARQLRAGLGAEQGSRHGSLCRLVGALGAGVGRVRGDAARGDRARRLARAARRLPHGAVGARAREPRQHDEAAAQPAGHDSLRVRDHGPRARAEDAAGDRP